MKKYKMAALCLALSTFVSFISYDMALAADPIYTFGIGPGLDNLSLGDDYAVYQWGLKNDGQFEMLERKLDLPTIDLNVTTDSNGVDTISLPPLSPGNF